MNLKHTSAKTVFIYALCDPRTNEVMYVGKTVSPAARFVAHLADNVFTEKTRWLMSLREADLKPTMEILEEISNSNGADWQEPERFWISYWRFMGARLTNASIGGRGDIRPETPAERHARRSLGKTDNAYTIATEHLFDHGNGVYSTTDSASSPV